MTKYSKSLIFKENLKYSNIINARMWLSRSELSEIIRNLIIVQKFESNK